MINKEYTLLSTEKGLYVNRQRSFDNPCYVIGGGDSLKNFDFSQLEHKTTIVSNKAIFDVPNADYFITTDYTFLNHMKKEKLYTAWKKNSAMKFFVVNYISDVIQIVKGKVTDTRFGLTYNLQDFDKIIICKSAKSIGYDFENFNSGYNSGYSCFQLAVLLGYNPIYLLGMDMTSNGKETHYHGGYGKNLNKMNENLHNYGDHFLTILERLRIEKPELNVISCSDVSTLNKAIKYKSFEETL